MANVTAIIPTYNEELNIKECLLSLKGFVEKIISEPESYTLDSMMNVFDNLEENISAFLENSKEMTEKERVEARYQRFRSM